MAIQPAWNAPLDARTLLQTVIPVPVGLGEHALVGDLFHLALLVELLPLPEVHRILDAPLHRLARGRRGDAPDRALAEEQFVGRVQSRLVTHQEEAVRLAPEAAVGPKQARRGGCAGVRQNRLGALVVYGVEECGLLRSTGAGLKANQAVREAAMELLPHHQDAAVHQGPR